MKNIFKYILCIAITLCLNQYIKAQDDTTINIEIIKDDNFSKNTSINYKLIVTNNNNSNFEGKLKILTSNNVKCISSRELNINLSSQEKNYFPLRFIADNKSNTQNDEHYVTLLDKQNNIISIKKFKIDIPTITDMAVYAVEPFVYIKNDIDSIKLNVSVRNLGNIDQIATVVYKINGLKKGNSFIELSKNIPAGKSDYFEYSISPTELIKANSIHVNVTAFKGESKDIFGNTTIIIQQATSKIRYKLDEDVFEQFYIPQNTVTLNYRDVGNGGYMTQLQGSGAFDLKHGYLTTQANMYTTHSQNLLYANNTNLAYNYLNSEFKIGNINEGLEMPLFGRGFSYKYKNTEYQEILSLGIIDQNSNLLATDKFGSNGIGAYGRFVLNPTAIDNSLIADFVHKEDVLEKAKHNVIGLNKNIRWGNNFKMKLKSSVGHSNYNELNKELLTQMHEVIYQARTENNTNFNGNVLYSDKYFPGNRKGVFYLQQNITTKLSEKNYGDLNIYYSNVTPQSLVNKYNFHSSTSTAKLGFRNTDLLKLSLSINLKFQNEISDAYANPTTLMYDHTNQQLRAYQGIINFSKYTTNGNYGVYFGIEEGIAKYTFNDNYTNQFRGSLYFKIRDLNINFTHQNGSFFLSEYMSSLQTNNAGVFKRTNLTLSYNNSLWHNRIYINSGASVMNDIISGISSSLFFNIKAQVNPSFIIYTNSSFYRYWQNNNDRIVQSTSVRNIEVGITYNFKNTKVSRGSKGKIKANLFYDTNGNNIRDEHEEVAKNYSLKINKQLLTTDSFGNITYAALPYGTYGYTSEVQESWYLDTDSIKLQKSKVQLSIPLKRKGTIVGKIKYDYDEKTNINLDPKIGGLVFGIYQNENLVHRAITNNDGEFTIFLSEGTYTIAIIEKSLQPNTYCTNGRQTFEVKSGELKQLETFEFKVKEKKINIKKFGNTD